MLFQSPPPGFLPAKKIVSLVPSITELLWHLGLEQETLGITKFCVHPAHWLQEKSRIGGTKNLRVKEVIALQPDLVIASREENVKEQVDEIASHAPVFLTDVVTLQDAIVMIRQVGQLTGKDERADLLSQNIEELLISQVDSKGAVAQKTPALYLIWKDPYMTVGGDSFISHMLNTAGFENVCATHTRYPVISVEEMAASNAQLIFLSSEPYPFQQSHAEALEKMLPNKHVLCVDGEMFSWYGPRMVQAAAYFQQLRNELQP